MEDHESQMTFDAAAAIAAAAKGDQEAWSAIVAQYSNLVWAVARSHRLSSADAADAYQGTWLRLVEHLGDIRDTSRLGAWLCTTARRESLSVIRRRDRHLPIGDSELLDVIASDNHPSVDDRLMHAEETGALWNAFVQLSENCQRLLRVAFTDPPPSYTEISDALDIPVGSIGPTRARCLANLRSFLGTTTV
jgi:RNA polymerase sigma factor (sigma-70 family)